MQGDGKTEYSLSLRCFSFHYIGSLTRDSFPAAWVRASRLAGLFRWLVFSAAFLLLSFFFLLFFFSFPLFSLFFFFFSRSSLPSAINISASLWLPCFDIRPREWELTELVTGSPRARNRALSEYKNGKNEMKEPVERTPPLGARCSGVLESLWMNLLRGDVLGNNNSSGQLSHAREHGTRESVSRALRHENCSGC